MATRYCVGSPLNSTAAWSTTSGGASGASVPLAADDAIFDALSPNCSVGTARSFLTLNFTGYTNTITMDATITVSGNITLAAGMTIVNSGGILNAIAAGTLTANGKVWNAAFQFGGSVTYTLADQWDVASLAIGNSGTTINGAKLRVAGGFALTSVTTTIIGTSEIEFYGTGTIASSHTTGSIRTPITFAAGSNYTITGTFGYGTGTLRRDPAATLNVSAATLNLQLTCTLDCNGMTWPIVTISNIVTLALTSTVTFGTTTGLSTGSLAINGEKLTFAGNTTFLQVTGNVTGTSNLDFVGPLTLTCAFTTGRFSNNVTFVSGTVTLVGTFSHGGSNLTKSSGCTLVTTGSTLILQAAASTVNLSPAVFNNVTIMGTSVTHTLTSILYCGGTLSLGSTTATTTINGSEIVHTGTSITSALTTGTVTGTSILRIKETCTLDAAGLTAGRIAIPHIVDAPGKTITITKWITDATIWQILSGTIVNAAGQTWVNTSYVVQRSGRAVDPFLGPNSNPRLYFRAWTNNTSTATPLTTLTASSISTAQYRRKVSGIYGSAISVGALTDTAEFSPYTVGNVIKHSCALGNLYSIDAPLVASSDGAEAVRLELSLTSGTVDIIDHILKIGYSVLEDSTINDIALELSPILTADMSLVLTTELPPILTADMSPVLAEELWQTDFGELSSVPNLLSTMRDKISWLFMWARNKATQTASQRKLYADDGVTVVSIEPVDDDGTTFTKGKAQ